MILKYRPDIDGLRAVAVLSVVCFHFFPGLLPGGFIGVDIFFVISGYLITRILFTQISNRDFKFLDFYSRRVIRIFPALLLVLISVLCFGWYALWAHEYKELGKHLAGASIFISNFLYWNEVGYFDVNAEFKPLLHLWSLGIEEQFYILWPILIWLFFRFHIKYFWMIFAGIFISFAWNIWNVFFLHDITAAFFSPFSRMWELLLGGLLAYFTIGDNGSSLFKFQEQDNLNTYYLEGFSFLGLALITIGVFTIDKSATFPGFWAILPTLGTFILLANQSSFINQKLLSHKWLVLIGIISYPLYLWHWPIISYLNIMEGGNPSIYVRILGLITSIILAFLTYKFIEKPIKQCKYFTSKTIALVLMMGIVGFIGSNIYSRNGLEFRSSIKKYESKRNELLYTQDGVKPSHAQIALMGDSHADHLMPGLRSIYGQQIGNFSFGGCMPFYDVDRYDSRTRPNDCLKIVDSTFEEFGNNKNIKFVIMSSMGPTYISGEPFKEGDKQRLIGQKIALRGHPTLTDPERIYKLGMEKTFDKLALLDKQVIFVIDIPELGFHPLSCFETRPFVFFKHVRSPCAVSRIEYDKRVEGYKNLVLSIASKYSNVTVIDPTSIFCDENWCWASNEEGALYRDSDHLSNIGSQFLARYIQSKVNISSQILEK